MSWELKSLDELGFIGRGKSRHRPRNDERLYNGNYPFIQTGEIQASNLYISEFTKTYNEFGLSQSKLWKEGTLCLSIVGANTAETAILSFDACFPDSVIGINAYEGVSDNKFIKYLLDFFKVELKSISEGTARENLSLEKLLSKKRKVPDYNTQKRIASILSNYDDLIENNNKRIFLLEETAQNIYKEWFVNFRFPNYENTEFNAESGLPLGWRKLKVNDFFDFVKGIEVGSKNYLNDEAINTIPFLRVGDISKRDSGIFVYKELVKDKTVDVNDILISFDGSIGNIGYGLFGAYSSGLRKIIDKNESFGKTFSFCLMKSDEIQQTIKAHAKGSTILHAGSSIQYLEFVKPSDEILSKYKNLNEPFFNEIINLTVQNQKLKEARDILLPRLMNRTIEV